MKIQCLGIAYARSGEKVVAHDGYHGTFVCSRNVPLTGLWSCIRTRHETINHKLKTFKIIGGCFRHAKQLHGICFHSFAQVMKISLQH